jgi:hypothetical protein
VDGDRGDDRVQAHVAERQRAHVAVEHSTRSATPSASAFAGVADRLFSD